MKKTIFKILSILPSLSILLVPVYAFAAPRSITDIFKHGIIPDPGEDGIYEIADIIDILGSVLQVLFTFAAVIAVIYIIIGGYHYVTAYGNPETAEKGKQTLTWAIIGLVIVILAFVIVQFVWNAISPAPPPLPQT